MNVKFIAVGKVKDKHLAAKIEEYSKRLNRFAKVTFLEVKDSTPEKEGKLLCELMEKENGYCFVLSEEGKQYTSPRFAKRIQVLARDVVFVIGGPEGLAEEVKRKADELLSLSEMTFVHEMAKLFLVEQVYRAFTIMNHGKYHK